MALEDGIQGGYVHFVDCLPRENLLCDVSLLLGETVMARYTLIGTGLRQHGIKVSSEVAALLQLDNKLDLNKLLGWCPTRKMLTARQIWALDIRRHSVTNYNLSGHISTFHHGIFAALSGLIFGLIRSILQLYWRADDWARMQGAFGCLFGLIIGPFYVVILALISVLIFFDRLAVGIANGCFGKEFDYVLDPSWKAKVHDTPAIQVEKEAFVTHGIPKARRIELHRSLEMVVKARIVFQHCHPTYPGSHFHFVVVKLDRLTEYLNTSEAQRQLCLTSREIKTVIQRLDKNLLPSPSAVRRHTFFLSHKDSDTKSSEGELSIPSLIREVGEENQSDELSVDGKAGKASTSAVQSEAVMPSSSLHIKKVVAHINPLNFLLAKKQADATDISFSHFVQALQFVSKEKFQHLSRRRSALSVAFGSKSAGLDDFSEFLN